MKPFIHLAIGVFFVLGGNPSPAATGTAFHLAAGWEYYQVALGSLWEVWPGDAASDNVTWSPVTLPHCFNALESVDPDVRYGQGPAWYRTRLKLANPFPGGRTLLHFTDAAARALKLEASKGEVPPAILCDYSCDAEGILSDLSDFNRYGGLYRYVQLAVFANFIGDGAKLAACRQQFKGTFVPKQMAADGSFPLELQRTRPTVT